MPDQETSASGPSAPIRRASIPGLVLFYLIVGVVYVLWNQKARTAAFKHPWLSVAVLVGVLIVVLIPVFVPALRTWLENRGAPGRAAVLIFLVSPLLIAPVALLFLFRSYQFDVFRALFVLIVSLFPGVMFYLFLANRKVSLLNEFIANLDRLGLLPSASPGPNLSISRRFTSYLRKFESNYGTVSGPMLKNAMSATASSGGTGTASSASPAASRPTLEDATPATGSGGGTGTASSASPTAVRGDRSFTSETAVPVLIATLLVALGWFFTLPLSLPNPSTFSFSKALSLNLSDSQVTPIQFAFLGAYFFSLQMLFRRYVLRDLRPSAYVAVSMRIVLAVIGIWVVMSVSSTYVTTDLNLQVVGFAVGVFPPIVWQFVVAAFGKFGAGWILPSLRSELPISDLDGLTVWNEARFEEEGIENIPNMATADIVELMIQTRLPPDRIIDWVDQAVLYTNLGPEGQDPTKSPRHKLRAQGVRTASSLLAAYEDCKEEKDRQDFEKILAVPEADGQSPMRSLVSTLRTNPNLALVLEWKKLTGLSVQPMAPQPSQ